MGAYLNGLISNAEVIEELIAITRELTDALRKNRTVDWQLREDARSKMRMMVKRLLKKHRYPPEGEEEALDTVMRQCEHWADNEDYDNYGETTYMMAAEQGFDKSGFEG